MFYDIIKVTIRFRSDDMEIISLSHLIIVIDVVVVSYLIYLLIQFAKKTRILNGLKGILVILMLKVLSDFLQLKALSWIIDQVLTWGVLAGIIIFQTEIRRSLEQLGQNNMFRRKKQKEVSTTLVMIDDIMAASAYLSKRHIGALICFEVDSPLQHYVNTGVSLKAAVSNQLVVNIFTPNTPLHDGAIIIKDQVIQAASCVLPLTEQADLPQELGTRHRAGLGLSEVSDSICLIISEETGHLSIAQHGVLNRHLTIEECRKLLSAELLKDESKSSTKWVDKWIR